MHPDASEEEVEACIDDGVDMLLARLDATDAQRTQVKAIARRTVPELRKLHAGRKGMKESMMTALGRDPINPAEVEKLRQEAVAAMTRGSELLSRAAVETAQVLTPEQRKKVATFMKRHRGRGPGFGSF
jgi:Spy/CpxP family protein refolding chaperone